MLCLAIPGGPHARLRPGRRGWPGSLPREGAGELHPGKTNADCPSRARAVVNRARGPVTPGSESSQTVGLPTSL